MKFTYAADARPIDGFTIRRGIHRGGFGEVYYAVSDAGKEVALKLLTHDFDTELRGIRQCLNLKHPNLITLFDVKTDHDGDHWVVMEYVNGSNLEEVLTTFPQGLPITEVADWMQGIVSGVEYLHDRGLIHRDLKPANIYRENGVVKIGDVGLSKRFDGERRNQHTESIGTVYYMAPEITHGKYGPSVDVYSLGIILYELLTGKLPFNGETSGEILMKQLSAAPDLSVAPANLRSVLAHALEKDPQKRTSSARQLWQEFENALAGPTTIPESHFVNGHAASPRSSQTSAKETDHPGDTNHKHGNRENRAKNFAREAGRLWGTITSPPSVPQKRSEPKPPGRHKKRNYIESHLVLILTAIVLMFIPWHNLTVRNTGFVLSTVAFWSGLFWLLLWAREHWRPDTEPARKWSLSSNALSSMSTDLAGTLAVAGMAGATFTVVPLVVILNFSQPVWDQPQLDKWVFCSAVTIVGAWMVIASRWMWGVSAIVRQHPRLGHLVVGVAVATAAYGLDRFLITDLGLDVRNFDPAKFDHLGVNPLVQSNHPTWFGFATFFGGMFFLLGKRFVAFQEPLRSARWKVRHPFIAGLIAWGWVHLFAFPQFVGIVSVAAIVATVQLAAPWQPTGLLSRKN